MMANENETTPAPLSDAEVAMLREAYAPLLDRNIDQPGLYLSRLFTTLAARDAEVERLKSQVAIHETWRQDVEFRYVREHEDHMREYAADGATLAAYREIVAAVADGWSNALGTRIGKTPADGLALKARARALLADTQTPGQESE